MKRFSFFILLVIMAITLWLLCSTPAYGAEQTAVQATVDATAASTLNINPNTPLFYLLFICIITGILAALDGIGEVVFYFS